MIILPAIDIKDGNCVRLFKGDYSTVEKVCDTPYKAAEQFKAAGAQYMHMVDLDGAKDATLANADLIIDVACHINNEVCICEGSVLSAVKVNHMHILCACRFKLFGSLIWCVAHLFYC